MQKAMGLPVKQSIFRTWGQNLLKIPGAAGYFAGLLFHEAIALFAAVLYALFFDFRGRGRQPAVVGAAGRADPLDDRRPGDRDRSLHGPETGVVGRQGLAYKNYGALDVIRSLIGHLGFGASVGIFYALLDSDAGPASSSDRASSRQRSGARRTRNDTRQYDNLVDESVATSVPTRANSFAGGWHRP